MAKYDPLRVFLGHGSLPVELSFAEVGLLVGGLPPSAYRRLAWWLNSANHHAQASAWLDVGRRVESVDRRTQRVRFSAPGTNG